MEVKMVKIFYFNYYFTTLILCNTVCKLHVKRIHYKFAMWTALTEHMNTPQSLLFVCLGTN